MSLAYVIVQRLLTDAEHECEAKLKFLRLQEVALAADDKRTCGYEHACWWCLGYLIGVDPVHLRGDLVLPAGTVAHFKSGCFIETQSRHGLAAWVFENTDCGTVQLRMHKEISAVHIALHQRFILLSITSTDDKIVFTSDEPDELLEPENLTLHASNLGLLEFFKVSCSCFLGLFYGDTSCVFRLALFRVRLLPDLKVLLNVELG